MKYTGEFLMKNQNDLFCYYLANNHLLLCSQININAKENKPLC